MTCGTCRPVNVLKTYMLGIGEMDKHPEIWVIGWRGIAFPIIFCLLKFFTETLHLHRQWIQSTVH